MKNVIDLYEKMKNNSKLAGSFNIVDGSILWNLSNGIKIVISDEYIGISKTAHFFKNFNFHWHPDESDIYNAICDIGTRGNVTVIHRVLFGLCTSMVYSGPESKCEYKRKWLFGKYFYIYAI